MFSAVSIDYSAYTDWLYMYKTSWIIEYLLKLWKILYTNIHQKLMNSLHGLYTNIDQKLMNSLHRLYTNIDQKLMNSLHGLLNCGIGG